MRKKIILKRGPKERMPQLEVGEIAFTTDENALYIGSENGNKRFSGSDERIEASRIEESSEKRFISGEQIAEFEVAAGAVENLNERIHVLETKEVSDGDKVRINAESEEAYVQDIIDNSTIQVKNNRLVASTLENLVASINELNFLQGANDNIQQQINNLSGVSAFRGVHASYDELSALTDAQDGQYAVVSEGDTSSYYFYYENQWVFSHSLNSSILIDINNSTSGILQKSRYEVPNASEIDFIDTSGTMKATNTQDAILELFQNTNNFIKRVASIIGYPASQSDTASQLINKIENLLETLVAAINFKGVAAHRTDGLQGLATKVTKIPNVSIEGTVKKLSKVNVTAPYELKVQLQEAISLSDITATLIEFVPGEQNLLHYNLEFDNGDEDDFEPNPNVVFDGVMKLRTVHDVAMVKDSTWTDEGFVYEATINKNDWVRIDGIEVVPV